MKRTGRSLRILALALGCGTLLVAACTETTPGDTPETIADPASGVPAIESGTTATQAPDQPEFAPPLAGTVDCGGEERTIFSCRMPDAKRLSVCLAGAAPDRLFAQYRFGAPGEPHELRFPRKYADDAMRWTQVPYAGGGETQARFPRQYFTYVVYSRVMRGDGGPVFEDGVLVWRDGHYIGDRRCEGRADHALDVTRLAQLKPGGSAIIAYPEDPHPD